MAMRTRVEHSAQAHGTRQWPGTNTLQPKCMNCDMSGTMPIASKDAENAKDDDGDDDDKTMKMKICLNI